MLDEEDGRNETIIGIDRKNKWISAIVGKKKGVDASAIEAIGKEIENSGFNRVIMKPDQEPAIKALLQAVKNERGEEVDIETRAELIPERSPLRSESKWRSRKICGDMILDES